MAGAIGSTKGAMSGCRVLELARVIAGPYACQILGDFGADVIKLEQPGEGDYARHYPNGRLGAEKDGDSAYWIAVNRNKRSLTVDFSKPEGREIVRRLAAQSDVLVENYKAGTLARYGLDYASLREINPRLVYCSVTGYGQDGPYAPRPGIDPVFQAQSGFMQFNGEQGMPPLGTMLVVMDLVTGYNTAIAVLAALRERDQVSGVGQHIDMSLFDCSLAFMGNCAQEFLVTGQQPPRLAAGGRSQGGSGTYPCRDGSIYVVIYRDEHFRRFCGVLGCPELASDPRFDRIPARMANAQTLMPFIAERIALWDAKDLSDALAAADVAAGVVNDFRRAFDDPQARHRGMTVPLPHPKHPDLNVIANPARLGRTPPDYRLPPPLVGQHSEEILRELLAYDAAGIAALRSAGVV